MPSPIAREAGCTDCPLHETARHVCLMGTGPAPADLMIIGEAPGYQEDRQGAPFVGDAGHLLDTLLEKSGISRERAFITNAVKCRPPDNRDPKPQEISACARHLQREIDAVKPKYVLLLGNAALKAVLGETGITKQRGRARYVKDTVVMPSLHPASAFYAEGNRSIIQQDLHHLKTIMTRGGTIPRETKINSILVDTPELVEEMIAALTGVVAFDIETDNELYPWHGDITAFGFGTAHAQYSVLARHPESVWTPDDLDNILGRAVAKLKRCFVVGQNIKFDQLWVFVHYGLYIEADFDTMLCHYLLDENAFHDLEFLARLYFNAPAWDISHGGVIPAHKLVPYLAHDTYYTRNLFAPLNAQLSKDRRLKKLFQHVVMPLSNLFVRIEAHGACINAHKLDDAELFLDEQIQGIARELNKFARLKNWRSTQALAKLLYSHSAEGGLGLRCPLYTKNGAPSTAESALNMLDHPIIGVLKRYRAAQQEMSFFIKGWRPFITPTRDVERLHPNFKLHGTVTGRASAEHPNLQQTTRAARVRSVITAPPGWVLMEADLSQIELRLIAHDSKDPTMLEVFRNGQDIHWRTALREVERGGGYYSQVFDTANKLNGRKIKNYGEAIKVLLNAGPDAAAKIDKIWEQLRYTAKSVNFGYCYGMWWRKYRIYARDNYGLEITDRQAQESRASFFQLYSTLENWHDRKRTHVSHEGQVRALDGQLRRLPAAQARQDSPERQEAFRQAINSPIQGFASKINFMVLLQMAEEFPWSVFRPIGTVHDSILAEVREDQVEACAARILEIIKRPALFDTLDIHLDVPLEGEVKIGPWGSGVKWKKQ